MEEIIYSGKRISLKIKKFKINGEEIEWEIIETKDAVGILPVENGKVYLIKQYRYPIEDWLVEIPAGKIENESPEEAAKRELLEETGFIAENLRFLGCFYLSPGNLNEKIYLFLAEIKEKKEPKREKHELIEILEFENIDKAIEFCLKNKTDTKTLLALLLAKNIYYG